MSIQSLAQKLQSEGRNGESLLVHMTPSEVGGLQALAKANGGSLTVNPKTGLVEANFLEAILPTVLGVGLSFIPGVGPLMAAGLVGGGTALATGDLGKGLMAGLGAAGGAGLGGAITSSGATTLGAAADTANFANLGMNTTAVAPPTAFESFKAGLGEIGKAPGAFLKSNLTNIGMAAAPAIGGAFEQSAPEEDDSMIRPYTYSQEVNPQFGMPGQSYYSSQSFTPQTPMPASGFSGFKQGGITSLAVGGEPRYQQPTRTVDPAVTAYNQQLMQRAQKEYVQTPQLGAFQSALPNAGAYNPEMGAAYQQAQAAKQEAMKKIQANQFGYQYDPTLNTTIQTQPTEDQFTLLQRQIDRLRGGLGSNPYYSDSGGEGGFDGFGMGMMSDAPDPGPGSENDPAGQGGQDAAQGGRITKKYASGGMYNLGSYSDGGRLLKGPGDGVSDSIPATIEGGQPARLADGEFVVPARIVGELGNGSTEAGARQLYAMMDRIAERRNKSMGIENIAVDSESYKDLPA
jgi:hypothetical protein